MTKSSAVYDCDIRWDRSEEDVSVFNPNVSFTGPNGHKFAIDTPGWYKLGRPQKIRITVEAIDA